MESSAAFNMTRIKGIPASRESREFEMSRPKKILLGAATLWPPLFAVVFVALMILWTAGLIWLWQPDDPLTGRHTSDPFSGPLFAGVASAIFVLGLLTAIDAAVIFVVYAYHIVTNGRLTEGQRISWVLLLLTTAALAMPLYFYLYVWRVPGGNAGGGATITPAMR
jgi:hypothetical protein